ncbi:MAG: Wzz/FepE/Etk N-terminal domain-containing protein [Bacilli bacterium]
MEEINFKELLEYFYSKYIIMIVFIMVFTTLGILYVEFFQTPMFKSNATLILVNDESNEKITQNDVMLNKNLVSTYSEIMKSKKIINQVIENLDLNSKYSEISKMIHVDAIKDTEIINVTVVNSDSAFAAAVADEIVDVFSQEVVNIYNLQNVSIIDSALVSEEPYNVNNLKYIFLSFLSGIIMGISTIFTLFYLDSSIKNSEEIETKFELPVIGVVPLVEVK